MDHQTTHRRPSAIPEPLHSLKDIFAGRTIQELVKYENSVAEGFGHHGYSHADRSRMRRPTIQA
jgi:hypothetical protein